MTDKVYIVPVSSGLGPAIEIDSELCIGCNSCVDVCRRHLIFPNSEKGKPPTMYNPEECWFCACCVEYCPVKGAIKLRIPISQRVSWKRKKTGEYLRVGMKNPPPPNTRPPIVP